MINESLNAIDKSIDTIEKIKWIKSLTYILESKWLIIFLTLLGLLLSSIFVFGQKPIYTASARILIKNNDKHTKNNIIEIIDSNLILHKVIKDLNLELIYEPLEVELLGHLYAKYLSQSDIDKPKLSFFPKFLNDKISNYNWSNETVKISEFNVSKNSIDYPFLLKVTSKNTYSILRGDEVLLTGAIGQLLKSKNCCLKIKVSKIKAEIGTIFVIKKLSLEKTVGLLRNGLSIKTNDQSDLINLVFSSENKKQLLIKSNYLLKVISSDPPNLTGVKAMLDNVTIVDNASLDIPSKHVVNKQKIIAIGIFSGFILGIIIALLRASSIRRSTIFDPEKLEKIFGIPLFAVIPYTKYVSNTKGFSTRRQKTLLAIEHPNDPIIENLRSLRTNLYFALQESKNNVVMITGPSPGIGKSFISSNLSAVLAAGELRTLLIDADMRRGYLHSVFLKPLSPGLSDLICKKHTLEEVIHTVEIGNNTLDYITRGQTPVNPSELLLHSNFEKLISELSDQYDLILIDSPPINAVTDPTIIGRVAGIVFMVVLHRYDSLQEVNHAINKLLNNGISVNGFIVNAYKVNETSNMYSSRYLYSYYSEYKSDT